MPEPEEEPLPKAPDTVVFDIGEVLIDETRVWAVWAELIGVSPLTFAAVLGAAIVQGEDNDAVFAHLGQNIAFDAFVDAHTAAYGGFRADDLYPDVRACITALQDDGFTVAIAGNQPAERTQELKALDLGVEHIVTSEELGVEKPDPAFFTAVCRLIGVKDPSRILYVGDRVDRDVIPAYTFGMATCWLQRGPYGRLQACPSNLDPDLTLEGLGELPTLLAAWRDATDQ
jgi:HAD superfamily hydrolase (TIGR01509 family)